MPDTTDPRQVVKSSTMSWSEQCQIADMQDAVLSANPGVAMLKTQPWVYEFSGVRRFLDRRNPYGE